MKTARSKKPIGGYNNTVNYNPYDDNSPSGFRRPPNSVWCLIDYINALSMMEDDGNFLYDEVNALINDPDNFFAREFHFDKYGRKWTLPLTELCPVCRQPIALGGNACNHKRLHAEEVRKLGGELCKG